MKRLIFFMFMLFYSLHSLFAVPSRKSDFVTASTQTYRNFSVDNVLHSVGEGDISFCLYVPRDYDGSKSYALFVQLAGYEGLRFQGVAQNIKSEDIVFEAQNYVKDMIIVAPQLSDWREKSARETVALTRYFLQNYNIDSSRVYLQGYSGGGETGSLVMQLAPELYTRFLHCSSQWDGNFDALVKSRTPVYIVIGENDEYYTSRPARSSYKSLSEAYRKAGLSEKEIAALVTLDVKPSSYFEERGVKNQHGGGARLFSHDEKIMNWLFKGE